MRIKEITQLSLCLALLCVASYLSFPIPLTPIMITGQTIMINIIALVFNPKQSVLIIFLYLMMGLLGLPVFAGGTSGLGSIFSPGGGFLIAFLIATPLMSLMKGKMTSFKGYLLITMMIGMPIIYLFGALWMSIFANISLMQAMIVAVLPFIAGDVIKCVIASTISYRLTMIYSTNQKYCVI